MESSDSLPKGKEEKDAFFFVSVCRGGGFFIIGQFILDHVIHYL